MPATPDHRPATPHLPPELVVIERGWLSANNILGLDGAEATLVDSGYVTHAAQTVELVRRALGHRRLTRLVNTHSHSDHVGGNAALRAAFGCEIWVPAGLAEVIERWDERALLLSLTDQRSARFRHDRLLGAGATLAFGGLEWRTHAAPGHDMEALLFHSPDRRILISGDALWQDGFGVQFAELLGEADGLAATRHTLEAIGRLSVERVIPGHGAPFADVEEALERAFSRLAAFEADPARMARNALRALLCFALLEHRRIPLDELAERLAQIPIFRAINRNHLRLASDVLAETLAQDLLRAGVARREHDQLVAN